MWKFIMYAGFTIAFISSIVIFGPMLMDCIYEECNMLYYLPFIIALFLSLGIGFLGYYLRPRYNHEKDKLPDDWESYEIPYQGAKFDIKEILDYAERNKNK